MLSAVQSRFASMQSSPATQEAMKVFGATVLKNNTTKIVSAIAAVLALGTIWNTSASTTEKTIKTVIAAGVVAAGLYAFFRFYMGGSR